LKELLRLKNAPKPVDVRVLRKMKASGTQASLMVLYYSTLV
jgi:hypothetical protein